MNKTELLKNMNSTPHDPSEYIRGIQQVLISDKKRKATGQQEQSCQF